MTKASAPDIRLDSLTDLVECVPVLVGFHPRESMVLVAVEDGRVVLTARSDLPPEGVGSVVPQLDAVWRRLPRATIVAMAFSESLVLAWLSLADIDEALPCDRERVLVHVDRERWYDAPDADGVRYDAVGSAHLAHAAFSGRIVRASRDELRTLVEARRAPADLLPALERLTARKLRSRDLLVEARALVRAHDSGTGVVEFDLDQATLLSIATHDLGFLDATIGSMTRENAPGRLGLWLHVVRESVPRAAGPAIVAAGLAAWLAGEGALATVCLEALGGIRAPAAWSGVLEQINADAAHPDEWEVRRDGVVAERLGVA
ncbi:MAG: DUF4192 family protein [Nigerium sp.]|nr:DUF4192 family protein [Nigerium sp.]